MRKLSDYVYSKVARVGAAGALAATLLAVPGIAYGDSGYQDHYRSYGHSSQYGRMSADEVRRMGTVNGYAEGYEHGMRDRNARVNFDYNHTDEYRRAMVAQDKSLLRLTIDRWGPIATGGFPARLAD